LLARRGDAAGRREVAEEAYSLAKRCSPWLEAICGYTLAGALFPWGEVERGMAMLGESEAFMNRIDSKWQLHLVHLIKARVCMARGLKERVRAELDMSLALAAREGYIQYLSGPLGPGPAPIADALVRGVEAAHCQELLIRMGPAAVPTLLELAVSSEPQTRRAAIYPLVRIGGEEAIGAIRRLLYDGDELVRDSALAAVQSLRHGPVAQTAEAVAAVAVEAAPASALRVGLLGPFRVEVGGQHIGSWRTAKVRDLMAYLVLAGDRPVSRDQIIEALWPDTDPEGGQSLLHTTLYYLRRTLKPTGDEPITFAGGAYRLERTRCEVDFERFQALAAGGGVDGWRAAADLYRGELLEGFDYPWCEAPRARARMLYLEVLRSLAAHLRRGPNPSEAIDWLQRLVQADPLAEDGHLALMECYAAAGNRSAALQQYRTLQNLLDEELGLEPGPEAQAAYRRLLG
jgi:DNA-binding SARP family transcriptional activator